MATPLPPIAAPEGLGAPASPWAIGDVTAPDAVGGAGTEGGGFAGALGRAMHALEATQTEAAGQAQALATGRAQSPEQVVMAVEQARFAMQLASQLRNRGVEAVQEIFRTAV